MGKVLKIAAVVVSVAIVFVPGVGPAISAGLTAAMGGGAVAATIATGMTTLLGTGLAMWGMSAFAPKQPEATIQEAVNRLSVSNNSQKIGDIILGTTAMGTNATYAETDETDKEFSTVILAGACHRINAFKELYFADELAVNDAGVIQSAWAEGLVDYQNRLGTDSQSALSFSHCTYPSNAHFYGTAVYGYQFDTSKDKLSNGMPNRVTQVCEGIPVYDPRKDSTRGGVGTQRADDQDTWAFNDGGNRQGENPVLQVTMYFLGWYKNTKRAFGMGIDPENINWSNIISMANACDESVNGYRRYVSSGIEIADGNHNRFFNSFLSSFGLKVNKSGGGVYSVWVPHDDLVSIWPIGEDDLLGEVKFEPTSLKGTYNVGRGKFVDPAALYQLRPSIEITEPTAITNDGRRRVYERDMPLVQNYEVAQRVLRYQVRRSRYRDTFAVAVNFAFLDIEVDDIVTLTCPETAGVATLCRVQKVDVSTKGVIALILIEEHAAIYDDTTLPTSMPPLGTLKNYDAAYQPPVTGLAVTATSLQGIGGRYQDVLKVTWDDAGGIVKRTDVEYKPDDQTEWIKGSTNRINDTQAIINGLLGGVLYDVRVRHVSLQDVIGPWAAIDKATTNDDVLFNTNICPWRRDWVAGVVSGNVGDFYELVSGADTNEIILVTGPHHEQNLAWKSTSDAVDFYSGGFYFNFDVEDDKDYRLSCWVKKGSATLGRTYFGCATTGETQNLDGSANSNPYFVQDFDCPRADEYFLLVAHLRGNTNGTQQNVAGLYDPKTGQRVIAGVDFKITDAATEQQFRVFNYQSITGQYMVIYDPVVEEINGTERTISALLNPTVGRFDKAVYHGASLFLNSDLSMIAPDGRPLGIYAGYGTSDKTVVSFYDDAQTQAYLYSPSDASIGFCTAAFPVEAGRTYTVTLRMRGTLTNATGTHVFMEEYSGQLGTDIVFVCGDVNFEEGGVQRSSVVVLYNNGPITGSFVNYEFEYTPTVGTEFASLELLNWDGHGLEGIIIDRILIHPKKTDTAALVADATLDNTTVSYGAASLSVNTAWQTIATITPNLDSSDGTIIIDAYAGLQFYVFEYDDFYVEARLLRGSELLTPKKVFSWNRQDIHDSNYGTVMCAFPLKYVAAASALSGSTAISLQVKMTNLNSLPNTFVRNWAALDCDIRKK